MDKSEPKAKSPGFLDGRIEILKERDCTLYVLNKHLKQKDLYNIALAFLVYAAP